MTDKKKKKKGQAYNEHVTGLIDCATNAMWFGDPDAKYTYTEDNGTGNWDDIGNTQPYQINTGSFPSTTIDWKLTGLTEPDDEEHKKELEALHKKLDLILKFNIELIENMQVLKKRIKKLEEEKCA